MTWIVTCPDWQNEKHKNTVQSWSLSLEELTNIGRKYFEKRIACKVCDYKFSLQQGVKESFSEDNPFVIHDFQFNSQEYGNIEIKIGQLKVVKFKKPFEDLPQVYLTPYLKPVHAVSGHVTKSGFCIFSSNSGTEGETRNISWSAYGNREQKGIPIWRKLLSSSKEHQLRKDFQSEIVYLESAFEVFISEFLWKKLNTLLNDKSIKWILKFSIEEQLKIGFTILTDKSLSQLEPEAHGKWQREVKEIRDDIIHRGIPIKADQARKARDATFDLITRVNSEILEDFRIQRI